MDEGDAPNQQGGLVLVTYYSPRIFLPGFTMGRGPVGGPEALHLRNTRWWRRRSRISGMSRCAPE